MRLHDFAVIANWQDRLSRLAALAEPERWNHVYIPAWSEYVILDSYIKLTFLRLEDEGKVLNDGDKALFNTGLLTPHQEEIYCLLTRSDSYDETQPVSPSNKQWFMKGWVRSGDAVVQSFGELPSLARYWDDPAQLIFDPSLEIEANADHILRENLNRFPISLGGQVDAAGIPTDLVSSGADVSEAIEADEAGATESHATSSVAPSPVARNALEGAIQQGLRLARRSYRLAVPQFYRGQIQLLLPLYLQSLERPDLALTLQRSGDYYRAATVLYPDWAYGHARLLSRPNSEWLG